ncbi:unnamed protein product [Paramecium sonneborni]|uniref:Uncharacterized protein n=1 Tax=Paramecium sonneborni TaxID=65129 RepID=A0A8S1RD17_9CILI|nr:unnamed protein product [Paramecium sonneborni]
MVRVQQLKNQYLNVKENKLEIVKNNLRNNIKLSSFSMVNQFNINLITIQIRNRQIYGNIEQQEIIEQQQRKVQKQ